MTRSGKRKPVRSKSPGICPARSIGLMLSGFTAADAVRWVATAIDRPVDVVIANGENAAAGFGITPQLADEIVGAA